jgi:uncharacterized membrane protein YagU involved in acid resistance
MKMEIARNLWRRKLRTTLIVTGIVMGIFALMKVGATIALPVRPPDAQANFVNQRFTVVGILNQTLTAPDTSAYVSLHDAQMLEGTACPRRSWVTWTPTSSSRVQSCTASPG